MNLVKNPFSMVEHQLELIFNKWDNSEQRDDLQNWEPFEHPQTWDCSSPHENMFFAQLLLFIRSHIMVMLRHFENSEKSLQITWPTIQFSSLFCVLLLLLIIVPNKKKKRREKNIFRMQCHSSRIQSNFSESERNRWSATQSLCSRRFSIDEKIFRNIIDRFSNIPLSLVYLNILKRQHALNASVALLMSVFVVILDIIIMIVSCSSRCLIWCLFSVDVECVSVTCSEFPGLSWTCQSVISPVSGVTTKFEIIVCWEEPDAKPIK